MDSAITSEIKLPELPEADGWIFQHEDTGLMTTLENDGINNPDNFKENNPRHVLCEAIYSERKLHAYARAAVELNRVVVDEAMAHEGVPKNVRERVLRLLQDLVSLK